MKITLPNGATIETESQSELQVVLGAMGLGLGSQRNEASDPVEANGKWTAKAAGEFLAALSEAAKRTVQTLLARGDMTTTEVAGALGYTDNRPIGGLMNAIRKTSRELGVECPVDSAEVNGQRRLILDVSFRSSAKGLS